MFNIFIKHIMEIYLFIKYFIKQIYLFFGFAIIIENSKTKLKKKNKRIRNRKKYD